MDPKEKLKELKKLADKIKETRPNYPFTPEQQAELKDICESMQDWQDEAIRNQ